MANELKAKVEENVKLAMKARDKFKLGVLRCLLSALKQEEIDTRLDLSNEKAIEIVQKEIKKRRDAREYAEKAGRTELVAENDAEIVMLQEYLGRQLSEEDLRGVIKTLISSGSDSIGKVMSGLNASYKGQFEGRLASSLIKELLT